jgi:hypothetical protein
MQGVGKPINFIKTFAFVAKNWELGHRINYCKCFSSFNIRKVCDCNASFDTISLCLVYVLLADEFQL